MIRNATNLASKATRNCSTSQESNKVKKSSSTSSKNSNNISTLGNSMSSSIKTRVETSSSNKKSILNTSTSNKSLKTLRENANGANCLLYTSISIAIYYKVNIRFVSTRLIRWQHGDIYYWI